MNDDADLQPAVAAEFVALAGLLDSATDAQWDTPSLCAGWRVREVIAHMTMAARYSEEDFMAELRRYEFDFGRLSNEIAARDAELPADELVASLQSVPSKWQQAFSWHGAAMRSTCVGGTAPVSASRSPVTGTGFSIHATRGSSVVPPTTPNATLPVIS